MTFPVTVGENSGLSDEEQQSRFNKMADMLYNVTGYKVDNQVVMEGVPKMYNFKLLVDFKPLRNKAWLRPTASLMLRSTGRTFTCLRKWRISCLRTVA